MSIFRQVIVLCCFCWLSTFLCLPTRAGILLRLEPSTISVTSGQEIDILLKLVDTGGEIASAGGLVSGGGRILVDDSSTATASLGFITVNPAFDFNTLYPLDEPLPSAAPAGYTNLGGLFAGGLFPLFPDANDEILLGSFKVTVTGPQGSNLTLISAALGGVFAGNVGDDFTEFDVDMLTSGSTISISAAVVAPEPQSMWIWSVIVLSIFGFIRLQRQIPVRWLR